MIEKPILKRLSHWVLTDKHPAFNDIESVTAIEMVARLYGKMQELIDDYNSYVDKINEEIERFENDMTESFDEFKACVTQIMNDYIATIDTKMNSQDAKIQEKFDEIDDKFEDQDQVIAEAVEYMKTNLQTTINNLFQTYLESGEIHVDLFELYEEVPEYLHLGISDTPYTHLNLVEISKARQLITDNYEDFTVSTDEQLTDEEIEKLRELITDHFENVEVSEEERLTKVEIEYIRQMIYDNIITEKESVFYNPTTTQLFYEDQNGVEHEIESGGSGESSGESDVFAFAVAEGSNGWEASATYQEIKSAIDSGKVVYCIQTYDIENWSVGMSGYYMNLCQVDEENNLDFCGISSYSADYSNFGAVLMYIRIASNGTISQVQKTLTAN